MGGNPPPPLITKGCGINKCSGSAPKKYTSHTYMLTSWLVFDHTRDSEDTFLNSSYYSSSAPLYLSSYSTPSVWQNHFWLDLYKHEQVWDSVACESGQFSCHLQSHPQNGNKLVHYWLNTGQPSQVQWQFIIHVRVQHSALLMLLQWKERSVINFFGMTP